VDADTLLLFGGQEQAASLASNLVYIEKKDLPSAMADRLIRVAAFQNPEF
jgi:hypothetical protein